LTVFFLSKTEVEFWDLCDFRLCAWSVFEQLDLFSRYMTSILHHWTTQHRVPFNLLQTNSNNNTADARTC